MKTIHTQESGRSMIEMLGVLAIIGVLSVGGIAGYSQAMNKFKVTKTTDQIQTMVQNIRTLYAGQKTYAGLSGDATGYKLLYSAGVFTDDICPTGSACTTPMNPYGGLVNVKAVKDDHDRANRAFAVSYDNLPPAACVALATQNWGDAASGLIGVTVTNTTAAIGSKAPTGDASNKTVTTTAGTVPMALSTATLGCGDSGTSSSLVLYYK